jgi:D-3-phosphoglycerate dehydrogenase
VVNTARAGLVDEQAVATALRAGWLRAYATDVLATEAGATSPLLAEDLADRTLFTPHAGAQTVQAVDAMGRGAVDAVLAHLRGERPATLVPTPTPTTGGTA